MFELDSPGTMLLGLLTGVAFGFLLHRGAVTKHTVILRQLLLRDWTVAKIMGTAVAVGAIGFHFLVASGVTTASVKPLQLGALLSGALLFGVGLAILGYCPGTSVAAAGEGRRDAIAGVLGMVTGALAFVAAHPLMTTVRGALGDRGKETVASLTGTSPWLWVALLATAAAAAWLSSRARRTRNGAHRDGTGLVPAAGRDQLDDPTGPAPQIS